MLREARADWHRADLCATRRATKTEVQVRPAVHQATGPVAGRETHRAVVVDHRAWRVGSSGAEGVGMAGERWPALLPYLRAVWRQRWLIMTVCAAGCAVAVGLTVIAPKVYESSTT